MGKIIDTNKKGRHTAYKHIIGYIICNNSTCGNYNIISYKDIASYFHYHPNYISALLHQKTGREFTEILLEKRMKSAVLMMKNTTLSIEEIAATLGYGNFSNFYNTFPVHLTFVSTVSTDFLLQCSLPHGETGSILLQEHR